jgi:hypothetical protein
MNEKPGVQPVLQAHLDIEHAPFIAPVLDFFDPAPVGFGHAQLHEAKGVVGETRIIEPHPIAAARAQIGKDLAVDKLDQDSFRRGVGR